MQRVTITLDDALLASLERFMAARGYSNRSEAMRDLTRLGFDQAAESEGTGGDCVAAVVYVYDHTPANCPGGWCGSTTSTTT
jgi:CopG family nickel-responsive transcriptional regulator